MAWPNGTRSFKDALGATRQAIVNRTATVGEDVPLYAVVIGADQTDPTVVTRTAGIPIVGQRTSGTPTDGSILNGTASSGSTGNAIAVGGTGGTALPGTYVVTALPDNANVIAIGSTNANAAAGATASVPNMRGVPLQPGQAYIIDTDDLRSWKFAVRTANDGLAWCKVGS